MRSFDAESVETVIPGTITAVNADGTVDCRAAIRKVLRNGVFDLENPSIPGIPLMKLGGGYAEFSFPAKVGDGVLLVAFSRDSTKWKSEGGDDVIPSSCSGFSLNDLVAVPIVRETTEGAAKIRVTEDGDIVLSPASGRKVVSEADLCVKGKVMATDEVSAKCTEAAGTFIDATAIHLSTHLHSTAVGPSSPPTPGS